MDIKEWEEINMTELGLGTGPTPGTTTGPEEKQPSMSMNTDGSLTINIGSDDSGTRVRSFEANAMKLDFEECMEGVTEVEAVLCEHRKYCWQSMVKFLETVSL